MHDKHSNERAIDCTDGKSIFLHNNVTSTGLHVKDATAIPHTDSKIAVLHAEDATAAFRIVSKTFDSHEEDTNYQDSYSLLEILKTESISPHYQPIISPIQRRIIGFEGLSRGIDPRTSQYISPITLFNEAEQLDSSCAYNMQKEILTNNQQNSITSFHQNELSFLSTHSDSYVVALDRVCRNVCLSGFLNILENNPKQHLFINIDASIIERVSGSDYLLRQVDKTGIPHGNIVIEINEGKIKSEELLVQFVRHYRGQGFLIALDDMGAGFSNFDRISLLEPDIIKLDRSLIQGIENSYHKQEVFKCLVGLANRVGAVVIAEGVETESELHAAIEYGAHLIQGFFYERPVKTIDFDEEKINAIINHSAQSYMVHMSHKMSYERAIRNKIDTAIGILEQTIQKTNQNKFDNIIRIFIEEHTNLGIECAYILNDSGIQFTDTIFGKHVELSKKRRGFVFSPTHIGSDNSLKKYFYELMNAGIGKYISDTYISQATGSVCITISRIINYQGNQNIVLCIDFLHEWNTV